MPRLMHDSKFSTNAKSEDNSGTTHIREGRNGVEKERAVEVNLRFRERSRKVRTPAGLLGSRTLLCGQSQRRACYCQRACCGPAFRCVRVFDSDHHQQQGRCAALTAFTRTHSPNTQTEGLQELTSAVILVPVSSCGSTILRIRMHFFRMPCCANAATYRKGMGNSAHLVIH